MLNTKSVKHNYINYLWVPDDLVEVAEQKCVAIKLPHSKAKPLSLCLRVLEVKKDARLKELDERGVSEEELTEEMLWFDIEWPRLSRFALCFCGASSLQKIFPVVMQAGFAQQRYIKRHPKSGERICREDGAPLVYATYQEAQLDEEHYGTIIHQAFFESETLNEAIAALNRPPLGGGSPSQSPSPVREGQKNEGARRGQTGSLCSTEQPSNTKDSAARVGNPDTTNISQRNITPPAPKNQGVNSQVPHKYHTGTPPQPIREGGEAPSAELSRPSAKRGTPANQEGSPGCEDPLRQSANSKDSKSKNPSKETEEIGSITGGVAATDTLSHFDFFREFTPEAVLDLAHLILPLPTTYKSETRREAAVLATQKAAGELATNALLCQHGLVHLTRLLYYFADETSPCKHRAYLRQNNPGLPMRLWMLTESVIRIASKEMDACNWWPPELSRETDPLVPSQPPAPIGCHIDFARIRGLTPARVPGMDRATAEDLWGYISEEVFPVQDYPEVYVDYGCLDRLRKDQGYYVDLGYGPDKRIRLYSWEDWDVVGEQALYLDSPEFPTRLAAACQASQVA